MSRKVIYTCDVCKDTKECTGQFPENEKDIDELVLHTSAGKSRSEVSAIKGSYEMCKNCTKEALKELNEFLRESKYWFTP